MCAAPCLKPYGAANQLRTIIGTGGLSGIVVVALSLATMASILPAQAKTGIGTTAIATNAVFGTLARQRRNLTPGTRIFQNEHIRTGAKSKAQLLFLDQTSLSLGENSHVVLNTLVFNPRSKKGKVVLNAVSGAFRFISGSSPKTNYRIRTKFGTIGIRGTILQLWITGRWLRLYVAEGSALFCRSKCARLKAGNYIVVTLRSASKTNKRAAGACASDSGSFVSSSGRNYCTVMLDPNTQITLASSHRASFDVPRTPNLNDITPGAGSGPGAGDVPGGGPSLTGGHAPIVTGAGFVPSGLSRGGGLPRGLARRDPTTLLPPGLEKKRGKKK